MGDSTTKQPCMPRSKHLNPSQAHVAMYLPNTNNNANVENFKHDVGAGV